MRTNDKEICQFFDSDLLEFLKNQTLLEKKEHRPLVKVPPVKLEQYYPEEQALKKFTPRFTPVEEEGILKHTPITKLIPDFSSNSYHRQPFGTGFDMFS